MTEYTGLPFHAVIGQEDLKLALQLVAVDPKIGGVLASGDRGTGKSTAARAFAALAWGAEPVTLPINATEDRVVGGLDLELALRENKAILKEGLLQQADGGVLYVDEVNLLDDHIVNLLLDVTATGRLTVQRDGIDEKDIEVSFVLVGTMNPEEGTLRPQLLDRFGLMSGIETEVDHRRSILEAVLRPCDSEERKEERRADAALGERLSAARERLGHVAVPGTVVAACAELAQALKVTGHRGEITLARSLRALAALEQVEAARVSDLPRVARLALRHRRSRAADQDMPPWDAAEQRAVAEVVTRHGDS